MAQRTVVTLTDDLDPSKTAEESIPFSLDGKDYSIDLTAKNADRFRGLFQDYIAVASKVTKGRTKSSIATKANEDLEAIRTWARENGHEVADRGRIAQKVKDAFYAAAH